MNIVLIEGKDLIADTHCCTTATEVQNLIPLIDCTTGFYRDCARTGDKAPSVQIAAALYGDIAASIQPNLTVIPGHIAIGAAGSRLILTANAEATLHRESNALSKCQRSKFVLFRSCLTAWSQCSGSCREQCLCRIKRNQECDSAGNRIILIERSCLALESDFFNAVCLCICDCII